MPADQTTLDVETGAIEKDELSTPPWLADRVQDFFRGPVDLDPATNQYSYIRARIEWTKGFNGLAQDWSVARSLFMNPPYSNPMPFIGKAVEWARLPNTTGLLLVKRDHSTRWWALAMTQAWAIADLHKRPVHHYKGEPMPAGGKFPSSIIAIGSKSQRQRFAKVFGTAAYIMTMYYGTEDSASSASRVE